MCVFFILFLQITFNSPGSNVKTFQYSKDGEYLGCALPESVKIFDAETAQLVSEIPKKQIVEIGFSPKGTYISTWERPVKSADGSVHKNLIIWEVITGKQLISFTQKSQNNWNVQWTEDEMYFSRMVTGEVHFYDSKRLDEGITNKLRLENIGDFSISPGKSASIAVFIPEKNAAPAIVRIYSIANFKVPLAQKTFYKADKIQMKWNDSGTNLLVLTQTDVDKTNKSYYGETNLFLLSVTGSYDCRVMLDKEGPIHDVTWGPSSKEFVVIYGYMPAKATLFDHRANPIHEFGTGIFRNTVRFNPQGRYILSLSGFGNLKGEMDIWDRKTLKKIAEIEAPNSSESSWSPDGIYIMTAILSPRLRVDNGYKIWHYTGSLVHNQNIDELLQIQWRPTSVEFYPLADLPPAPEITKGLASPTKTAPATKAGAYLPPHARARGAPTKPVGSKNKKKPKQKKEEEDKKIRNLTKKLRQIDELKERQKNGDKLEQTQIKKIETEATLRKELDRLNLQ
ncbi:translation initiation factor eIF-2A [Rhizophagus irregularis]|uniref:Eukaryotic translation initiation factor 2A n=1 Tax=Rhizophagus irregularis TaxID=588596 RepID=A0A2N1NZH3_9GLOM|nr:translation initiation factor eIF-2A [Rhizophagus irregularis]